MCASLDVVHLTSFLVFEIERTAKTMFVRKIHIESQISISME